MWPSVDVLQRPREQSIPRHAPAPRKRGVLAYKISPMHRESQVADEDLHGFAVLVQRRRSHLDPPLVRTRLRRPHLEHFTLDAQLIPRTHGPWPAAFVKTSADN